jgi:hypothetical protein
MCLIAGRRACFLRKQPERFFVRIYSIRTATSNQNGDVEAMTESDIIGRVRDTMTDIEASPLAHYFPYTDRTQPELERIAALKPRALATMHGSVFIGDGEQAMLDYAKVLREVLVD